MKIKNLFLFMLLFLSHPGFSAEINNLFSAAILGKTERVKSLLADGVDVNGKTATGRTAMMAASFNGNVRVARILLAYGADVNLSDNLGSTALMDAVVFGSEELVKLLITAGADIYAVDKQNVSVIDKAKKTDFSNIVILLEKAAPPKENDSATEDSVETEENSEITKDSDVKKEKK